MLLIGAVSQAAMAMLFLMILLLIPQLLDFGSLPSRGIQSVPSGINGLPLFGDHHIMDEYASVSDCLELRSRAKYENSFS